MNLIDLAVTTFTESTAERADTADELAEQARIEFLESARSSAGLTLCPDAAALDWQYVTEGLPDQVEEARARLVPGRPEYLRYLVDHSGDQVQVAFELVQPCAACHVDRVSPVTGLFHLGQLLSAADAPHPDLGEGQAQKPGPLAAIEQTEVHAARVTRLARLLLDEHPDAGLTVDHTYLFGYKDGEGRIEIHFNADSLDSLRRVAAAHEAEVTERVSGSRHGLVLEHGSATFQADGIEVQLQAYSQMPEEAAAAWRARQDQDPEGGEA
ncbi:hypothetical protein ACRJ4B_49935 [Streptomyces sp. GTA36]